MDEIRCYMSWFGFVKLTKVISKKFNICRSCENETIKVIDRK